MYQRAKKALPAEPYDSRASVVTQDPFDSFEMAASCRLRLSTPVGSHKIFREQHDHFSSHKTEIRKLLVVENALQLPPLAKTSCRMLGALLSPRAGPSTLLPFLAVANRNRFPNPRGKPAQKLSDPNWTYMVYHSARELDTL